MAQTFNYHGLDPIGFESVSNVTATNSVDLGTRRIAGGEDYVYIYNGGSADINVGQFAVLSFNSGYTVTVSSTTGYDVAFGVCKHAAIASSRYGWLLTRGFTTITNGMAGTALVVGDPLFPAGQGKVQNLNVSTTALCGNVGLMGVPCLGVVVSACASGGTGASQGLAYVKCFG